MSIDTLLQNEHDERIRHEAEFIDHQWNLLYTDVIDEHPHEVVLSKYRAYFDKNAGVCMDFTEWLDDQHPGDVMDWFVEWINNN